MRTSKPFSTISYNSIEFLQLKLNELVASKKVAFWSFVRHSPEDDQEKAHIHLFIEPAVMTQTEDLKLFFAEIDISNPSHPLTCLSCHSSKFDDWYMYAIHDPGYLASKHQTRVHRYNIENVVTNSLDDLYERVRCIDSTPWSNYDRIIEFISQGMSIADFLSVVRPPIQQMNAIEKAWNIFADAMGGKRSFTYRNGRNNGL